MSVPDDDTDLASLTAELARSMRALQRELEPDPRGPRPPTPRELLRFTEEVAIPGVILLLETNVQALRLLQRTIRLADGRVGDDASSGQVRDRAAQLSQATLDRLDTALAEVQKAVEARPTDDDARDILDEARSLRDEIDARLASNAADTGEEVTEPLQSAGREVPVDVEAELQSIKEQVDEEPGDDDGENGDGGGT